MTPTLGVERSSPLAMHPSQMIMISQSDYLNLIWPSSMQMSTQDCQGPQVWQQPAAPLDMVNTTTAVKIIELGHKCDRTLASNVC